MGSMCLYQMSLTYYTAVASSIPAYRFCYCNIDIFRDVHLQMPNFLKAPYAITCLVVQYYQWSTEN